jgi:hypothetical protein
MPQKELFTDHDRWYSLAEDEDGLLLAVVSGGVAMFEVRIRLSQDEADAYRQHGKSYLDELARTIAYSPSRYRDRWITDA